MTQEHVQSRPAGWFVSGVLLIGTLLFLGVGIWIFADPVGFQSVAAPWAPLGEHFLRDAGAFQIGIGAMALAVLAWRDSIAVLLAGLAVASILHAISHFIDADTGTGVLLGVTGLLFIAGLAVRVAAVRSRA